MRMQCVRGLQVCVHTYERFNVQRVYVYGNICKNGKATGMNGIPVEVWKCLGEEGIDMLWDLMQGYTSKRKYQRSGEIV